MNVVMLEDFEPKLMVLSNKVIVNDGYALQSTRQEIVVADATGDTRFRVTGDPLLTIRGQVRIKDELFTFSEDGFHFRGANMKYVAIDCAGGDFVAMDVTNDAMDFNVGDATIHMPRPESP